MPVAAWMASVAVAAAPTEFAYPMALVKLPTALFSASAEPEPMAVAPVPSALFLYPYAVAPSPFVEELSPATVWLLDVESIVELAGVRLLFPVAA